MTKLAFPMLTALAVALPLSAQQGPPRRRW
jgi:hypothetical protein